MTREAGKGKRQFAREAGGFRREEVAADASREGHVV